MNNLYHGLLKVPADNNWKLGLNSKNMSIYMLSISTAHISSKVKHSNLQKYLKIKLIIIMITLCTSLYNNNNNYFMHKPFSSCMEDSNTSKNWSVDIKTYTNLSKREDGKCKHCTWRGYYTYRSLIGIMEENFYDNFKFSPASFSNFIRRIRQHPVLIGIALMKFKVYL